MEISVKFNQEELKLIWQALKLGAIHVQGEEKSGKMSELQKKIETIGLLSKSEESNQD